MNKTKKGTDYSKAAPALVKQVKEVIGDAEKHTYSVSKVYAAYNSAFGLREQPQTCSSCLRNRVRLLRDWLKGYDNYVKANPPKPTGPSSMTATESAPIYIDMKDGEPVYFTPDKVDTSKGKALFANGKKVKPGKYTTVKGEELAVQPGGKATLRKEDLT